MKYHKVLKEKWDSSTPLGKFNIYSKIGDFVLRLIGVNVFNDCSVYFWSYGCAVTLFVWYTLSIYTIVISFKEGTPKDGLLCLCASGLMGSVCLRILYSILSQIFSIEIFCSLNFTLFTVCYVLYRIYSSSNKIRYGLSFPIW